MMKQIFHKFRRALLTRMHNSLRGDLRNLATRLDANTMLLGKLHVTNIKSTDIADVSKLSDTEFQVYSQFGEDGIIQFLINNMKIPNPIFVEFGVESYEESNTRFLLINDNWQGFIMDGSKENMDHAKNQDYFWRQNLTATDAYITKNNINDLISGAGISGDIGILSVDIGGNDYWVWDAVDVVSPRIIICEWNGVYGPDVAVTIAYDENFSSDSRYNYHYSGLHSGASLEALKELGSRKGYQFVGSNSAGNNAFFIRDDVAGPFEHIIKNAEFVESQYRDSKDKDGNYNYVTGRDRLQEILDVEVYETKMKKTIVLRDLLKGKDLQD